MRSSKVFNNQQISWLEEGQTKLSYQMLFKEEENLELDENVDLVTHLNNRDEKWKNKLKVEREKIYKEAYEVGKAVGLQEAREEIDAKIKLIKSAIELGHEEWKNRQRIIDPGLLDLAFEIAEAILGIPVENEAIRIKIREQLVPIFQKLDDQTKPVLKISETDLEFVKDLKNEFADRLTVHISGSKKCNPGEFELETSDEIIVHKFCEILNGFKSSLTLPSWK